MSQFNVEATIPDATSLSTSSQIVTSFKQAVIDNFQKHVNGRVYNYQEYLALPASERSDDEADAVDMRFARNALKWLGYAHSEEWIYNQHQVGKKSNRPDYTVKGSIGIAFIWEDKNSTHDLDEKKDLAQMRRYCMGTAGYAVWCNMRHLLAVRFSPGNTLKHEILADVSIEHLFGVKSVLPEFWETQATNLALFHLLFSKKRFTQFSELIAKIAMKEQDFENKDTGATSLEHSQAIHNFITGSRESLNHLRLAALSQVREALDRRDRMKKAEIDLRNEWMLARDTFIRKINFSGKDGLDVISQRVADEIARLTARLGEVEQSEIRRMKEIVGKVVVETLGIQKLPVPVQLNLDIWLERALRINSALLSLHFEASDPFRIAEAYRVWSERQNDKEDVKPDIFAEQVAYVFFVRLLLVRVLEDKHILQPRIASDGGFLDWSNYVQQHFKELNGVGILNENFCNILARKAGHYYLHFFQQAIFDWFNPDDFLLVETLEFLCRYNFQHVTSDIVGFTYEQYIEITARKRKGHFLTRQDVVEYMLDLLEYTGPQIIGRSIFDPACGSGSFLVHAARRYRRALVAYYCNLHNVSEEELSSHKQRRLDLAHHYLEDLTKLFYGMELNPFACYLAEMNMLIQGLDDLSVLQQAGDIEPIERFHIYNTDSLDLPREVLDSNEVNGTSQEILVPDRLSDRLTDEAHPIKARLDEHTQGFFYIISNPPYVSSRQEEMDVNRFRSAAFYRAILSGDTNLYLLFLRLGLYYLSDYGQMIYIVPLTVFGDRSAYAARRLLKTPPFSPDIVTRFYRGDILFPGVDQAVGIIRVRHSVPTTSITVSGGNTIQEVRATQFRTDLANVIEAVPQNGSWQGNWLIANSQVSLDIWRHVKHVSAELTIHLGNVLDITFDRKQGDVNATFLNPLRIGVNSGSFYNGDVAIYKGEDIHPFAPLPISPSDWARTLPADNQKRLKSETIRVSYVLKQLKQMKEKEVGIVVREVARLNTRGRLIASWFERDTSSPLAFTHELWRMVLQSSATEESGKALLALISSSITAYLINLFSTNNHVAKDDLSRLPIPEIQTMPVAQLAHLADQLLRERASLENAFVTKYHARLPEFDDGHVYIPPSAVLADSRLPKLTMRGLVGRGEVRNNGPVNGRIKALRERKHIICTIDPVHPSSTVFARLLDLFLGEPVRENETWSNAQSWDLPDPVAAKAWLDRYDTLTQQAQIKWNNFVVLQQQVDDVVADWYGFDSAMRAAIAEGLPWAKRRRDTISLAPISTSVATGSTQRTSVESSYIYAIGYEATTKTLEVEFVNGEIWQYQVVPLDVFQKFEIASSKGNYYAQEIKGKYEGKKL